MGVACGKDVPMTRFSRARGAAILIALAAALIVMLAVGILFTLMDSMISAQLRRERAIQVDLSEASALERLVEAVSESGPLETGSTHSYELAGVTTVFTVTGMEPIGPRRSAFQLGGSSVPAVVPSGHHMFAITPEDGCTVSVFFGAGEEKVGSFRLGLSGELAGACPASWDGRDAALLLFNSSDTQKVVVVTREGVVHTIDTVINGLSPSSVLTFGLSGDDPILAVSNGSNLGTIVDIATGAVQSVVSHAGTCPVVTPDGAVFGSPVDPDVFTLAPEIREAFFGDFNRDGREDIAWAGPRSLFCSTATGLYSASPSPDAALAAYGSVDGSLGLGARWSLPGGGTVWTRLNHDGFGVFQPSGALETPWSGRFYGGRTAVAGISGDSVILASLSGGFETVLLDDGEITWGDADGSDPDLFASREGGRIEAVYNPLAGDGLAQLLSVHSSLEDFGKAGGYRLLVYNASNGWRVFSERERPAGQ